MNLHLPFRDLLKPSLMRIAAILLSAKLKTVMDSSQHSITELLVRVKEAYGAERLIKVSNTYALEPSRFHDLNNEIKDLMLRMTKVSSLAPPPLTPLIGMSGVAIVLTAAMYQTQAGLITMGDFVTFLAALLIIMPPLKHLAGLGDVSDEAVWAALDSEAESVLKRAVETLTRGKTVFTVAHRYSTIEHADLIVAMENGEIRETGSADELLGRDDGLYHRLHAMQGSAL